jgi:(p)ppGpp synthase/HD superfamily hydrolase
MKFTGKIQRAIKFAIKTHEIYQKQKRKGKDVAYITHPLTVGIILAGVKASDDVVAAGILHDTIEDSIKEKKVTWKMLKKRFGTITADSVLSVTEKNKNLSWEGCKKEALDDIHKFSHNALLVKSADLISNVSEILDDHQKVGDSVFKRFNRPKCRVLWYYITAIEIISKRWKNNPLLQDLKYLKKALREI